MASHEIPDSCQSTVPYPEICRQTLILSGLCALQNVPIPDHSACDFGIKIGDLKTRSSLS